MAEESVHFQPRVHLVDPYLLTSLLFSLVCIVLYHWRSKRPAGYPPGPRSLPIIGNLHQLGTRPFIKFLELRKEYGDIIAIDFGSYRGVVLNNAKHLREALAMPEFCGRPKLRPFLERSGDDQLRGLITGEGQSHSYMRRFTTRHLRDFGMGRKSMESLIQEEMQELMNSLAKYGSSPFQTKYIFNLAAVNSLWWIIVGERFTHDDQQLQKLVKELTDGLSDSASAGAFFFFPWLTRIAPELSGYNSFMNFQFLQMELIRQKYHEQRATFESGRHRHFLDVFIQEVVDARDEKSPFYGQEGEKNLLASVMDLLAAGVETTATTMSWAVMLLALNPVAQEKLHAEVRALTDGSREPTLNDEPKLPYVQAVLAEVLRVSSIVPLSIFHNTTADIQFHGYLIPKDTMFMPNLYGANHDPEYWGDPEVFRPERFITPSGEFQKPGEAFLPFSMGKRSCIGEALARNTLFLFLATFAQRFRVLPNPAKPKPKVDYTPTFILQPKPHEYVLEPRV